MGSDRYGVAQTDLSMDEVERKYGVTSHDVRVCKHAMETVWEIMAGSILDIEKHYAEIAGREVDDETLADLKDRDYMLEVVIDDNRLLEYGDETLVWVYQYATKKERSFHDSIVVAIEVWEASYARKGILGV